MRKHQTDTVSLVFAVIFLGVVGWWFVARFTEISGAGFGLMVAGTLIAAGLIGLVSALRPRKAEPVSASASSTPGLFEEEARTTYEQAPPVDSGSAATFTNLDLHSKLSKEERVRADELIRKIEESKASEHAWPEEPGYFGNTTASDHDHPTVEVEEPVDAPKTDDPKRGD